MLPSQYTELVLLMRTYVSLQCQMSSLSIFRRILFIRNENRKVNIFSKDPKVLEKFANGSGKLSEKQSYQQIAGNNFE